MTQAMRLVTLLALFGMTFGAQAATAEEAPALKDVFKDHFLVGTALGTNQIMGGEPKALELVAKQFSAITPENCLKWAEVHPEPYVYNWEPVDKYVEFGEQHGMFIIGHTLCWHNQTNPWAFAGVDGKPLDRETALARLEDHISTVVGRYKGRIKGWDVVNEAILDNGDLRTGTTPNQFGPGEPWHSAIGDDYIEHCFRFAHAADPDAELYYNDFNEWHLGKMATIIKLVKDLQAKGVRIDGVGLQGHWGVDYPSLEEIDHMLTEYGKLGVKLMVTELDVNAIPRVQGQGTGAEVTQTFIPGRADGSAINPYPNGLPPEKEAELAKRYSDIFKLFVKHKDAISRVTFWGVHDGHSWLNDRPPGRKNYPLLFDREYQPKRAFFAVVNTAKK